MTELKRFLSANFERAKLLMAGPLSLFGTLIILSLALVGASALVFCYSNPRDRSHADDDSYGNEFEEFES